MYQQHISKTRLKHADKGNSVVNLLTYKLLIFLFWTHVCVSLFFTIADFVNTWQADESRADAIQALAMMVTASLYFIMFASFLARITIHVYQLGCLLIDSYLLIKLIGSSVVVYRCTRERTLEQKARARQPKETDKTSAKRYYTAEKLFSYFLWFSKSTVGVIEEHMYWLWVLFLVERDAERHERREEEAEEGGRRDHLRRVRVFEGDLRNRLRLRKG